MKKLKYIAVLALFISVSLLTNNNVIAQPDMFLHMDVDSCTSGGCEVITRQYTGAVVRYSIAIRCMDSGGNFGSWGTWSYAGVNPGSYCG